jgi:hypothetical protein
MRDKICCFLLIHEALHGVNTNHITFNNKKYNFQSAIEPFKTKFKN